MSASSRAPWQIEYPDEDPDVFDLFEAECGKHNTEVRLDRPRRRGR